MDLAALFPQEFDQKCKADLQVHSPGLLGSSVGLDRFFLGYALTRLLLQLGLISFVTQSLHLLLRRFNVPRITSEILVNFLITFFMYIKRQINGVNIMVLRTLHLCRH